MLVVGEFGDLLNLSRGNGESLEDLTDVGSLLHGDDTELILLVNPDEESLVVVMEDSTGLWPLTLKSAGLEILVSSLEKEVILDELLLVRLAHAGEGVVSSLEFAIEGRKSSDNLTLNLSSLLGGDSGSEWVVGQVTGNSDSGGVDHTVLISWEVWAVELSEVHVADVLVGLGVTVVLLDDLVEKWSESVISFVASSIDTNTRVGPLAAREDALLESVSKSVSLVLALLPHIAGEGLGEERGSATWEVWVLGDLTWVINV